MQMKFAALFLLQVFQMAIAVVPPDIEDSVRMVFRDALQLLVDGFGF